MNGVFHRPPASLAAFAKRFDVSLAQWNARGRVDLRVDKNCRVAMRQGIGTQVVLEAGLCQLPATLAQREEFVDRVMLRVTAHAARRASSLAFDTDSERILLQTSVDAEDVVALESGLEAFLNDLDYWSGVVNSQR